MQFEILGEIYQAATFATGRNSGAQPAAKNFICIDDDGYSVSLEKRKIYVALRDPEADKHGLLRIVDESGDNYLYPKTLFRLIVLPQAVRKAVLAAA